MNADLLALLLGTVLAVGAVGFVLYPLFFETRAPLGRARMAAGITQDDPIVALREIEFDCATGKLSEPDYLELKKTYSTRALQAMRAAKDTPSLDPVEARVAAYRATHRECPTCGLRPEPDAVYCSTCGTFLDAACPACKGPITEAGAAFCSSCGEPLAARSAAFV